MLGIADAEHAEDAPEASNWVIVPVACAVPPPAGSAALSGRLIVHLVPGTRARAMYGVDRIEEIYFCSFEVNAAYRQTFESAGLAVSGVGDSGEIRVVEMASHPFYVATLFQPQRSSTPASPDPLVTAFLRAAIDHRLAAPAYPRSM